VNLTRRVGGRAISPIGIGGARWSLTDHPDEERALATLHAALDAGVTLVDTAPAYTPPAPLGISHNETLVARGLAAHPRGAAVTVATKGGHYRDAGGFPIDARPATLHRQCRESLAALGVDRIPLYLLHWPDPRVPVAESVGALAELRAQGLVEHVGVCNVDLVQLLAACGETRIDAVQNRFGAPAAGAAPDGPVLDECTARGIAYLAYSPFGGPAGAAAELPGFAAVAAAHGETRHAVVIAWLLARSPVLVPIVGAGRPASVESAVRGTTLALTAGELDLLTKEAT